MAKHRLGDLVEVKVIDPIGTPYTVPGRIIKDEEGKLNLEYLVTARYVYQLDNYIKKNGEESVQTTGYYVKAVPLKRK